MTGATPHEAPALEERYVLFLDFLGTKAAAGGWPQHRVQQFLELLIQISQMQRGEDYIRHPQADGGAALVVRPEISTFSDNVVISWPVPRHAADQIRWRRFWPQIMCDDCAAQVGAIADMALRIGLLLRGGFSFGPLYHRAGVVFGEAMGDAYLLESKVADTPRIVVSDRIIKNVAEINYVHTLLQDGDGSWHLNYFGEMVRTVIGAAATTQAAAAWKQAHLDRIDQEIESLQLAGAVKPAAKWTWFKDRFLASNANNRYVPRF
jgi:hypothetical protein